MNQANLSGKSYAATVAIITAGVAWGVISIFIRQLSGGGLELWEIVLTRMVFSAFFLGVYLLCFDREKLNISLKDIAKEKGYNSQYLSRTFNRHMHMNFKKMLNFYRIHQRFNYNMPIFVHLNSFCVYF